MSRPPKTHSARRARTGGRARGTVVRRRSALVLGAGVIGWALTVGVVGFAGSLCDETRAEARETSPAASAAALSAPPAFDVDAVADEAMTVLAEYSDAARATEDALYAAAEALRRAATADEADRARASTEEAAAAVRADAEAYRAQLAAASAGVNTQPTGGDVAAQLAYLHQYVYDDNSAVWGDYNPYGGDCTNFTSQGLIARRWVMDDTWASGGEMWTATDAWIGTTDMMYYFDALGLSYSTEADLDRVRVGDVGHFSWGETDTTMDHTMTVSKVEYVPGGAPIVSFISHNTDGEARELMHVLYEEHTDSTVRIYHIP